MVTSLYNLNNEFNFNYSTLLFEMFVKDWGDLSNLHVFNIFQYILISYISMCGSS